MGKRYAAAPPPRGKKLDGQMSLLGWLALITAIVLIIALALLVYLNYVRPQPALPAAPQMQLPDLPEGPPLPQKQVEDTPSAALPNVQVQPTPQAPVTQAAPPPPPAQKQEPSGTVTWSWQLYPVSPSILGVQIQNQMPGYQFVALGISIWNQSTENVTVDNNAFTLNVDGRIYRSDQFATADAVVSGLPFLAGTTLAPKGSVSGQTAYMIPRAYSRVSADWQLNLPPTVKVVRVDPKVPMAQAQQAAPPQATPRQMPWDDE